MIFSISTLDWGEGGGGEGEGGGGGGGGDPGEAGGVGCGPVWLAGV